LRFDAIRRAVHLVAPRSVLELGAGQGAMASWLARRAGYTGVELDAESRAVAATRLADIGSGEVLPDLASVGLRVFDLVCAFEVLEHIEDDGGALREWRERVAPGGAVLLSVPAHPDQYGPVDARVGHFRRYDASGLERVLDDSGLRLVRLEGYGALLGQAILRLQNVLAARGSTPDDRAEATATSGRYGQPSGRSAALLRAAAAAPFRVAQLPLRGPEDGVGYVALARLAR
jgi:SAM-dependent methyltransferase